VDDGGRVAAGVDRVGAAAGGDEAVGAGDWGLGTKELGLGGGPQKCLFGCFASKTEKLCR